jgi:hypothetical protein
VHSLSKLILSQDNQVWIMNLDSHPSFVNVLTAENTGYSTEHVDVIFCQSLCSLVIEQQELPNWDLQIFNLNILFKHVQEIIVAPLPTLCKLP